MGALFPSSGVSLNGQHVVTVFSDYSGYHLREHRVSEAECAGGWESSPRPEEDKELCRSL